MYWLDIALLLLLGWGLITGIISGLLWQVGRVVSWVGSIYLAIVLNTWATQFLLEKMQIGLDPVLIHGAAYVGVFVLCFTVCHFLLRWIHQVLMDTSLAWINRMLGGVLGLVKTGLLASAICAGLAYLDVPTTRDWLDKSKFASHFARGTDAVLEWLPDEHKVEAKRTLDQLREWGLRIFTKQVLGEEKQ